jgi:putative aminopeptidase FrvX
MSLSEESLCALCDLVSVATSCGPAVRWARGQLPGWQTELIEDGFLFALAPGASHKDVRALYVAHLDEVGGMVLSEREDGWLTRPIGIAPAALADRDLLVMDYRDDDGRTVRPGRGRVVDEQFVLEAEAVTRLGAVFAPAAQARIDGEWIEGKALDPRLTAYAVVEAARALSSPEVAVMLVFAEECSMGAAAKGARFADRHLPSLELVANADVPGLANITGCSLEQCALRVAEGGALVDPHFGLGLHERLTARGCRMALAHARSGSQTGLFVPLARAVSLALPAAEAHVTPTRASLTALRDLIEVLVALPEVELA